MATKPAAPPKLLHQHDVSEVYAEETVSMMVAAPMVRFEFAVRRFEEPKAQGQMPDVYRVIVGRLALTPPAAIELFDKLNQALGALKQQGIIKDAPPPAPGKH